MQVKVLLLWTLAVTAVTAQNQPVLGRRESKVSGNHGWPNVAIVAMVVLVDQEFEIGEFFGGQDETFGGDGVACDRLDEG